MHSDQNGFTVGGRKLVGSALGVLSTSLCLVCALWVEHRPRGIHLGAASWGALFSPTRAIGQRDLVTGVAAWGLCHSCPDSTEEAFSFSSLIHMWAVTFPWLGNQPFSLQKQGYFARSYLLQASVSKFSHERNLCWVPRSRVTGKTAPS